MSNVIQIKHGAEAPGTALAPYELGYSINEKALYIGVPPDANGQPQNAIPISAQEVEKAHALSEARTIQIDLSSSEGTGFDGTKDITPGVKGVLPIKHGGTGAATASEVIKNLGINLTSIGVTIEVGDDKVLSINF